MNRKRIEAAAKALYGFDDWDDLLPDIQEPYLRQARIAVSAWIGDTPVYQEVCECPDCPEVTKPESVIIQTSIGYVMEVKSDES